MRGTRVVNFLNLIFMADVAEESSGGVGGYSFL